MTENDTTDNEAENEDLLYENIDDLKQLIDNSQSESESTNYNYRNASDDYNPDQSDDDDDSVLAAFSDFGEASEDDEENFMDAIREANNFKVKRKNRKGGKNYKRVRTLDPEVAQLLSEANEAFVRNDLPAAEKLFNEVIKRDARNFAAYETLGDIYQLQGRMNDCCNSWFLAAHLNSSDWKFWKLVAIMSADLDHIRQAIYCFSRVININHEDWESLYRRSMLYKQIGQTRRALEGFQKLHKNNPYDSNILRELAVLYVEYNKVSEAIDLYLKIFRENEKRREAVILSCERAIESSDESNDDARNSDEEGAEQEFENDVNKEDMELYPEANWKKVNKKFKCIPFDWSSLNILAELYLKTPTANAQSIIDIKRCARWIQRREYQEFWDAVPDDSEFDDRRYHNNRFDQLPEGEKNKTYTLPIDIRVRLGLCRLKNDNELEAMNHFQFLYNETFMDVADLYFEVSLALTESEKYREAIEFFEPLLYIEEYSNSELYEPLGRCYKEIEDYDKAKEYYTKVVEEQKDALDHQLTLAEINYNMGNQTEFRRLVLNVMAIRKLQVETEYKSPFSRIENTQDNSGTKRSNSGYQEPHDTEADESSTTLSKPLLEDTKYRDYQKKKQPHDPERERFERERRITSKVVDKYEKLEKLHKGLSVGNESDIKEWIETASDLIDVFSSVKNFFLKSRSKKFIGIIKRTKKYNTEIDYKLEHLSKLSEGDNLLNGLPLMEERVTLTSTTEMRGLSYDKWFELFMSLAFTIAKHQNPEDALSVIETAQEVNVFFQNPERNKKMKFAKLAIVYQIGDINEVTECLRGLLNYFQFNRKVLVLFMYCLSNGQEAYDVMCSTVQQKFFLRQLKAFDSVRYQTHVSGQASITNKEVLNPEGKSSPYLYYIYAVLLYSSRGFLSALQYLKALEKETPNDPMVNFLIALSHIHRAMQRLTASRHYQMLHGLTYLFRYHSIRSSKYSNLECQEADYNAGRAFHMIGLVSIAIEYYRKVLENYENSDLKRHAAYNSVTIYRDSGNTRLANYITEKYLTI